MSGVHKNPTISFRISDYERREIEARIKASGMMKKTFFTRCCIYGRICVVGKKETVYMLVQTLEKMQADIHKMYDEIIETGWIKEKESPVDGEAYTDIDKLTKEYLTEVKKSDADVEAAKWQLLYYLKVLKNKGIVRKGKLEFVEKNKSDKKVMILELTEELENELDGYVNEIQELIASDKPPEILNSSKCKKCAYYEYCYI